MVKRGGSPHVDGLDHRAIACEEAVVVAQRVGVEFVVVADEGQGSRPRGWSNRHIVSGT